MYEDTAAIVIDNGSSTIRAGFAGDDVPKSCFQSIIGRPKAPTSTPNESYIGQEVMDHKDSVYLKYPVEKGDVTDWDCMEQIWNYVYSNELCVKPEDHNLLLTEGSKHVEANRGKIAQVMFETFNVPALSMAKPYILALYAAGRTTGIVIDSGVDLTNIVPIYEGYCVSNAISRLDLGGSHITQYLSDILSKKGYHFDSALEKETARDIKEKVCYVPPNYEEEVGFASDSDALNKDYVLPDGRTVSLGTERFMCPEALFDPDVPGWQRPSILQGFQTSMHSCDIDLRKELYSNIVLAGGNTLFPGLAERMQKEITKAAPPRGISVKIKSPPERKFSVWIGGSILASLTSFEDKWITKQEYNEFGYSVIQRKSL